MSRPDCWRLLYGVWAVKYDLGCSKCWTGEPCHQFKSRSWFNRQIGTSVTSNYSEIDPVVSVMTCTEISIKPRIKLLVCSLV